MFMSRGRVLVIPRVNGVASTDREAGMGCLMAVPRIAPTPRVETKESKSF